METGDEQRRESIPVCTLFNEPGDDHPLVDAAPPHDRTVPDSTSTISGAHQITISTPDVEAESAPTEPTLCNVFQTDNVPSTLDDIFSHIGEDQTQSESAGASPAKSTMITSPTMESLRLNHSVDSFDVGDLSENETLPIEPMESDAPKLSDYAKPESDRTATPTDQEDAVADHLNPLTGSQSFISINSFSLSTEELDAQGTMGATDELSTEVEKLAINVGVDDAQESGSDNQHQTAETPTVSGMVIGSESVETVQELGGVEKPTVVAVSEPDLPDLQEHSEHNSPEKLPTTPKLEQNVEMPTPTSVSSLFANTSDKSGLFPSPTSERKEMFTDDDDPFAAALSNSELDRRRDAWIPSETTKTVLMAVLTNQRAIKLEPDRLTNPGLSTSEILEDPVRELVVRMTGSETIVKRQNLTMNDVQHGKEGIKQLVDTGNLRAAANLCAKLLTDLGQGFGQATQLTTNTSETLQLWCTRISILTQLKQFEAAATELSPFKDLDNPDLYYEFYPDTYPGRRGSMVPFSFRLLHAEFPRHVDQPQESLRRLHKILAACEKILRNLGNGKNEIGEVTELNSADLESSVEQWTERKTNTLFAIGNTLMQLKDYALTVDIYDKILELQPAKTVELQSGIGRIYLHMGDVRSAQQRFTEAEKAGSNLPKYNVQLLLNRGYMYIGTNNWKEAYYQFEQAVQLEPHNIIAHNNKAVCMLYLGKLKDAIAVLESATCDQNTEDWRSKVTDVGWEQLMTQGLIGNLSTLYELESSRYVLKKRALFLKQIAPTCGDSFDTVCFKEI